MKQAQRGFTLLEVTVALAIAAVLAVITSQVLRQRLAVQDNLQQHRLGLLCARELQARFRAVLRRSSSEDESGFVRIEGLELDTESHRVNANQVPVDMGPTEFRLLEFFMTHPERVYSREQLLDRVWGRNSFVEERTVDVHILRLRKALSPSGYESMIQTVRGAGYRLSSRA